MSRHSIISIDGNVLLDVLSESGAEPVSFDYAIGASVNVREYCTSLERGENERRTREESMDSHVVLGSNY